MLRRMGETRASARTADEAASAVACGQVPFEAGLEFNAPAHGTWNIVHIGMLVPEAHQIYVCAVNCMRGVVLTAQEMGASDRFSCVVLKESDIVRGTVEEVTLEGISGVLEKLAARGKLPPCVMVFPVCTHLFLGVSMRRVYDELERRWPGIDFVHAFMDPISRKRLFPDQRLRREMYAPVKPLPTAPKTAALVGSDLALDEESDLRVMLAAGGWTLLTVQDTRTYDEFLGLGRAEAILCVFPGGELGARTLAERLGRRYLYLPSTFDFCEIDRQEKELADALMLPVPDIEQARAEASSALEQARQEAQGFEVTLDALFHPRPFGLARLLLERGFAVTEILSEGPGTDEERAALAWIAAHAPQLTVRSMVAPSMRTLPRHREVPTLALGQRAAYHSGTTHFVNMVEGGGLWGYAGVKALARMILVAIHTESDARDTIVRKGLGCESVI